jgi:hypothetical protein
LQGGSPITIDTGRSRVDGDLLCNQFEKRNWGLESCGTVFKNPKGTYEAKDEYISYFELGAFIPWSVER